MRQSERIVPVVNGHNFLFGVLFTFSYWLRFEIFVNCERSFEGSCECVSFEE